MAMKKYLSPGMVLAIVLFLALVPTTHAHDLMQTQAAQTPENTIMLYFYVTEGSSDYMSEYDITINSAERTFVRWIPSTDEMTVIGSYSSSDWASNQIHPYTVDDRLFLIRSWGTDYSDHHDLIEFDPLTNTQLLWVYVSDPFYSVCFAVVDDYYFYAPSPSFDVMTGNTGGELKRLQFTDDTTGEGELLIVPGPESFACDNHLQSSDGELFDVFQDDTGGFALEHRSLQTGIIDDILFGAPDWNNDGYSTGSYKFAFDSGTAYLARQHTSNHKIEIWNLDYNTLYGQTILAETFPEIDGIHYFDADDRYLVLGNQEGHILLFDTHTNEYTLYEMGYWFYGLQILYLES